MLITRQKTLTINGSDRIHPDNDGHLVMAYEFLKAQGMAGKYVADVAVDAKSGKVLRSGNCTVSNVKNNSGIVTFSYLAHSLPYPIDTIARGWEFHRQQKAALKVIPQFMQEMDNEAFCVKGLKGHYSLEIDDVMIDTLSATQLAEGINLATYDYTPQYVQAKAVMELNEMRWEIERQFRDYGWLQYNFFMKHGMLEQNDHKAAQTFLNNNPNDVWVHSKANLYDRMIHREVREAMNKQMDVLVDKIYDINKPVSHRITLTPVKL